jgi:cytochrome b involved in lipid metabolism
LIPENIVGLPAHPLFVHAVVVLLPLSALGMIALVVIRAFRGKVQKYFVASALAIATASAYVTKESGQALNKVEGVSLNHQEWGARTFYAAIALAAVSAVWFWLDTKPNSIYATVTGILVVIVSLAAITATVLAGHSGSTSVWEKPVALPTTTSTEAPAETAAKVPESTFTLAEVAQHATAEDCWSAVNDNVYDLTRWISEHPGGSGPIESMCGVDATTPFNNQHNSQTEPEAELASFKIGILSQELT